MGALAVVLKEALAAREHPQLPLVVFHDVQNGVDVLKGSAHLMGVSGIVEFQNAQSRCAGPYLTVLALHEARDVRGHSAAVEVFHLHIVKAGTVEGLQGSPHAEVEQPLAVLNNAVHVVAGHALVVVFLFFEDTELVAVVLVQSVAGGRPDEAVVVEIHLAGETARQLLVGIKQLSRLRMKHCVPYEKDY